MHMVLQYPARLEQFQKLFDAAVDRVEAFLQKALLARS